MRLLGAAFVFGCAAGIALAAGLSLVFAPADGRVSPVRFS